MWTFLLVALLLIAALTIVIVQRDRARDQVDELRAEIAGMKRYRW